MRYIKIICGNNYAGCDEEFYRAYEDDITDKQINDFAVDILENEYSFYEPDGRFLPGAPSWNDTDYEDFDEEYEAYMESLDYGWEEITKEEYEANA